jgi:hypothetical protein
LCLASVSGPMTDYYPLIAKAVAGLNAQNCRRLYERGRDALIAELREVIPPLSEWVIARATFRTLMAEWIAVFYPMRRAETGAEDDLCRVAQQP